MLKKPSKGILLINLGTPDDATPTAVKKYLKEFLNDPRVIDIPALFRWLLVNLFILPTRSKKSAHAYQQIWEAGESPLLIHTRNLANALQSELKATHQVEFAMRYGNPSIASVLKRFQYCDSLKIVPLFPQYASASTGSAIEKTLEYLSTQWNIPEVSTVADFFADPGFISSYANLIQQHLQDKQIDMLIFSYHGLPERHIEKSECQASCDHLNPCPKINDMNRFCYRAQCYESTRLIAEELNLSADQYVVAFQSRLGRTPWIKPYTDLVLPELIQKGVKNIAIVCPSFVADCLETLEEVNIRTRAQWKALGGGSFHFIPCLNSDANWVNSLAKLVI